MDDDAIPEREPSIFAVWRWSDMAKGIVVALIVVGGLVQWILSWDDRLPP